LELITIVTYLSVYIGLVSVTFYVLSFFKDKKNVRSLFTDDELPEVTVIIPAYNEEKTIAKTIESIIASDYPNFQVFVIDDGSKDDTLKIAKKFENHKVKVFHKENNGKGSALNFGIEKAKTPIIFTMDADTRVEKDAMKKMVRYFKNEKVMCVVPSMVTEKPKTIFQRVQDIEYLSGLFLRKAFAAVNSIYNAPGAFSAYRKSFFDKYGGYEEGNITEDLEMSLKVQFNGFTVENCQEAIAYTVTPSKFKELLFQRRRWYFGLVKNLIKYRKIISPKYGDMGMFIIPIALVSIFFSVFMILYYTIKIMFNIHQELLFLQSINFNFSGIFKIDAYVIERFLFLTISNPVLIFVFIFVVLLGLYLLYASKKVRIPLSVIFNLALFFLLFPFLFGFWWVVSLFYALFTKKIKWR